MRKFRAMRAADYAAYRQVSIDAEIPCCSQCFKTCGDLVVIPPICVAIIVIGIDYVGFCNRRSSLRQSLHLQQIFRY